jgi:hypothetical protein
MQISLSFAHFILRGALSQFQDDDRGNDRTITARGFGVIILVIGLVASGAAILVGGITVGAFFSSFDGLDWSSLPAAAQAAYQSDVSSTWIALSILVTGIFIVGFFGMVHLIFGGSDESGPEQAE